MEQVTFADVEYEGKKRRTRRELFLERMEALIPWERLEARIRPLYPKAGRGRQPYPLAALLRVHCVQLFYNLSDPGMEDMLYEIESRALLRASLADRAMRASQAERDGVAHYDTGGRCLLEDPPCYKCSCGSWVRPEEWSAHQKLPPEDPGPVVITPPLRNVSAILLV